MSCFFHNGLLCKMICLDLCVALLFQITLTHFPNLARYAYILLILSCRYVPKIKDPLDTSNFDPYPEDESIKPFKGDQSIFSEF